MNCISVGTGISAGTGLTFEEVKRQKVNKKGWGSNERMASFPGIEINELERNLTVRRMRIMQITYGALVFSVMSLLVLFLFFFAMSSDLLMRGVQLHSQVEVMAIILWSVFVLCVAGGIIVFRMRTNPGQAVLRPDQPMHDGNETITDPAAKFAMLLQQGIIGRAVLLTIPALVSAVICLYWVLAGALLGHPERLVHVIPAFAQIAFFATTWPSRERILKIARRRLG